MISHVEAEALISARLDQPLDPIAERELAAHLATCSQCRAFAQSSDALAMGLRQLPYLPASSAVSRRVMARVDEGRSPWTRFGGLLSANPGPALSTFAIIVVLFLLGFFVLNRFVIDDRDPAGPGENQLAAQPTTAPTRDAEFVLSATQEEPTASTVPTATDEPTATEQPTTAPTSEPTATDEPPKPTTAPTDEPTATEPPPEPTTVPTDEPTATNEPPAPTDAPTGDTGGQPASVPDSTEPPASLRKETPPDSDDVVDLTSSPEGDERDTPASYSPTATSEPTVTTEPTATEEPTATLAPTSTPVPTEEGPPPILPIDGSSVVDAEAEPGQTPESTASDPSGSHEEESERPPESDGNDNTIQPIGGMSDASSETSTQESAPDENAIQSIDGTGGAEEGDESGTPSTESGEDESAIQTIDGETPESNAGEDDSTGTEGTIDLDANSEFYGDIYGEPGNRLILIDGRMEYGVQAHPSSLVTPSGLEARTTSTSGGQAIEICTADGTCTDLSSESSNGAASDEPLGWLGGGVFYARNESNTMTFHYLVPNAAGTEVESDTVLYDGGLDLAPTQPVYLAEGRIWVITAGGDWMALSPDGAQRLPSSYTAPQDLRFASTGQGELVGFVSSGQLVISPAADPGNPILTLPYAGVDFDISPSGNRIVMSTGTGIEIYDLQGTLVVRYASSDTNPGSVLWLNSGIVYYDSASGALMQIVNPQT